MYVLYTYNSLSFISFQNDPEFVTKIHEAYFKSLQDKLPT